MNSGGLRKRRRPDPSLPRDTVRDTSISFRALGVLLWIMDRPDGWTIRADQMAKDGKRPDNTNAAGRRHRREGREAIRTVLLDELAGAGYYRLERRRMLDGSIKMGTAASEDPVESWAAQYALFGRSAVPMVEQHDGTFLVQYPDGTLGSDDCEPPEMLGHPPVADDDESPGHTGDGFLGTGAPEEGDPSGGAEIQPVPRNPAPVEPAPGTPATGEPASDNTSPLVEEEEKGFKEKETPPTPTSGAHVADASPSQGGGEDSPKTPTLDEVVAWFAGRRPDWNRGVVTEALTAAVAQGLGDLVTAAAALRELAEGRHGDTSSPRRVLHDGKWWANVRPKATADRTPLGVRCALPGHERQPDDGCALCVGEVNACPDCPRAARKCGHTHQKVTDAGDGVKWLPERLRQRSQTQTPAEAAPEPERELVTT